MEENKIEIRYAQPQKTTHFMNRKVTMPRKSVNAEELQQHNASVNEGDGENNDNFDSAQGVTETQDGIRP